MLKDYDKTVQTNPDAFIKTFSSGDIKNLLDSCKVNSHDYEEWQKVDVKVKRDQKRLKQRKKVKVVRKTKSKADFEEYFQKEVDSLREHTKRIKNYALWDRI